MKNTTESENTSVHKICFPCAEKRDGRRGALFAMIANGLGWHICHKCSGKFYVADKKPA